MQILWKEAAVRRLKFAGKLLTQFTLYPDLTPMYADEKKKASNF